VDAYRSVTLIPKTTPRFARTVTGAPANSTRVDAGPEPIVPLVARMVWRIVVKLMRLVASALSRSIERRRSERLRRKPAAAAAAVARAKTMLILCKGNIIRSAFAAALLERELNGAAVSIRSAGLQTVAGRSADPMAITAAARRGVDLSGHVSRPVDRGLVETSDVIFVMDARQLVQLRRDFPAARGKSFLLTSLAPEARLEVRDPLGAEEPAFRACFDHIASAVEPIVRLVSSSAVQS